MELCTFLVTNSQLRNQNKEFTQKTDNLNHESDTYYIIFITGEVFLQIIYHTSSTVAEDSTEDFSSKQSLHPSCQVNQYSIDRL